jgi:succinylglutamate desuccinylase
VQCDALQLVGGIHGNEQACPELLLRLVHHLASGYGTSRRTTDLLDNTDIYVLPVSMYNNSRVPVLLR